MIQQKAPQVTRNETKVIRRHMGNVLEKQYISVSASWTLQSELTETNESVYERADLRKLILSVEFAMLNDKKDLELPCRTSEQQIVALGSGLLVTGRTNCWAFNFV